MNTNTITRPWRGVFIDGPYPTRDRDGEEIPEWTVCVGDEEAEPQGKVYYVSTRSAARRLGEIMARDRSLELIDDSTAA